MATKTHWDEEAKRFTDVCAKYGFSWYIVTDSVVRIRKMFAPGDNAAYSECDALGPSVLGFVQAKGGSTWGTDGASVGGYVGLKHGYYELAVSGVKKSFVAALKRSIKAYTL